MNARDHGPPPSAHPRPPPRALHYSHQPHPFQPRAPTPPLPPEILFGLFLFVTALIYLVGLSWPAVLLHPIHSLHSILELMSYKFQSLREKIGQSGLGVDPDAWDKFGRGIRGDDDDGEGTDADADGGHAIKIGRTYRELKVANAEAGGSRGQYYPGLLNAAGNLCFLNATLQSMASTPHLLTYLHRTTSLALTLSPSLPTPVASSLLTTLTLLNTPHTRPTPPLRPLALLTALAASSPLRRRLLASGDQQDANELWGMIREAIDEELARVEKERAKGAEGGGLAELLGLRNERGGGGRKGKEVKDPFLHLVSQKVRCMACRYTRDVRHSGEFHVILVVPPVLSCSIYDLLSEYTKMDLLSDYNCRKCSLLATRDKLVAQRDRLALAAPTTSSSSPSASPSPSPTPNPFDLPPSATPPVMTQSRKDRRKKVQKLVDKVSAAIAAGDFERELGDDVKVERVEGPAGKLVRFARTPEILTFHMNRSSHFGRTGGAVKNSCQVAFPEWLDFAPYCDYASPPSSLSSGQEPEEKDKGPERKRDLYRLSSLVVHYGSHSFGHYVAFRRRPVDPSRSLIPLRPILIRPSFLSLSLSLSLAFSLPTRMIRHPIVLAGMNVAAGPDLAAAVSNAGGLGVIGGVGYTPSFLRQQIRDLKDGLVDKSAPFGVDLLIPQVGGGARKTNKDYTGGKLGELVDICIEEKAALFVCAVGVPPAWVCDKFHAAGIPVANMVGAPKHCARALERGVDIIIPQGSEGGGHTGDVPSAILTPACVDAVKGKKSPLTGDPIIVIAAGGIHDGKGLAAALASGAAGVWVGTRFVCAEEAGATKNHQDQIIASDHNGTIRTLIYTGRPVRVMKTPFVMDWENNRAAEILEITNRGELPISTGDPDDVPEFHPTGAVAAMIKSVEPAKTIIDGMVSSAVEELTRAACYIRPGAKL
ncbi:hypothetical protein RQP46_002189 [Phenoliferia psychrophenolica]